MACLMQSALLSAIVFATLTTLCLCESPCLGEETDRTCTPGTPQRKQSSLLSVSHHTQHAGLSSQESNIEVGHAIKSKPNSSEVSQPGERERESSNKSKPNSSEVSQPGSNASNPPAAQGAARDAGNYEAAYDWLYDKAQYHSDDKMTHEGPVIEDLETYAESLAADKPPLQSVVVLGCSHGMGAQMLHEHGFKVFGVDVAKKAVEMAISLRGDICGSPPCFKEGSLTALPYDDSSFDAGLSSDVLEHISPEDVNLVVDEISRVVKHYLVVQIAAFKEVGQNGEEVGMGNLHLTVEGSPWWQKAFARKGWKLVSDKSDKRYVRLLLEK